MYDAVIVGCGPVGVTAAHLLSRYGLHAMVLERDTEPYDIPRAVHFDHEIMRIFQSAGLAELLLPLLAIPEGSVHFGADHAPIRPFRPMKQSSAYGWAEDYFFYQPDLERALRAALTSSPNVETRFGCMVTHVEQQSGHVTVFSEADGQQQAFDTRYVLACDGGRSTVRKLLDIGLDDLGFDEPWIVVDAIVEGKVTMPAFSGLPQDVDLQKLMFIVGDPARPTTHVPSSGNHRRWEFMLMPGETPEEMARPEIVATLLKPWLGDEPYQLIRSSVYRFHSLIAKQWQSGRIFLLGDAAHQTPPFFGQGMCHGVRDAANLAWKLAMVLRGEANARLLSTYESERRPHAQAVIETSMRTGRYICTTDAEAARRRDRDMRATSLGLSRSASIIPPITHGIVAPATNYDVGGSRFIQPSVRTAFGDEMLLDDATGAGWVMLSFSPADLKHATRAGFVKPFLIKSSNTARTKHDVPVLTDAIGKLTKWLTARAATGVLLRPDAYVFGTFAGESEAEALLKLLVDMVATPSPLS